MASPSSSRVRRYPLALARFNRTTPVRYFGIDVVIFGFPLVVAATGGPDAEAAVAFASMFAARCGGLTVDDYFDREADAVERPDRPIPAGLVSPGEALGIGVGLLLAGLALAALVNVRFFVAELAAYAGLFVSFGVVNDLDVPAVPTLATVTSVSMLSVLGWTTYGSASASMVVAFAATWCWDLAHDAVGAYLDRDGDAAAGVRTIGVVLPRRWIAVVAGAGLVASFVLLGMLVPDHVLAVVPAILLVAVLALVAGFYRGSRAGGTVRRAVEWYVVGAYAWAAVGTLVARGVIP